MVQFVRKYFVSGDIEIPKLIKETKEGIIEVNQAYMDSSEDSDGSYGSQVSA